MLYPRIIPCLLLKDGGLVKTIKFKDEKYVGDPINAVKIFNEKEVDELMILDIGATVGNRNPDFDLIEKLASECRMPLCYGGGVKTVDEAERLCSLGVEKIALSSITTINPDLVGEISRRVGSQSVVAVIDVKKKRWGGYDILTKNGSVKSGVSLENHINEMQAQGAGEIVINSIDRDGTMTGYDEKLINRTKNIITIPMTVLGGAGSMEDIEDIVKEQGLIGVAAGSIFVFKGKYRAVLINYPSRSEKEKIVSRCAKS